MRIDITAKSLKTLSKRIRLKGNVTQLEQLNGKLENPLKLDDLAFLIAHYIECAMFIKDKGKHKIQDCYEGFYCYVNSWYGALPKRYKYRKTYVTAGISCRDGVFKISMFRDECFAGNSVSEYVYYLQDTEAIIAAQRECLLDNLRNLRRENGNKRN